MASRMVSRDGVFVALLLLLSLSAVPAQDENAGQNRAAELEASLASATAEVSKLETEQATLRTELETSQIRVAELEANLASANSEVSKLQTEHEGLSTKLAASETRVEELIASLTESTSDTVGFQTELAGLRNELQTSQAASNSLTIENEQLVRSMESLKAEHSEFRKAAEDSKISSDSKLLLRVQELEKAWLPKWIDDMSEEAQVKLRDGAEWTMTKASELSVQGKEASEKAAAAAAKYMEEVRSSPAVHDFQENAAKAWVSTKEHAAKAMADVQPQVEAAQTYVNGVHAELEGFVSAKMEEIPELKPYNKPETVAMLVSAMIMSPLIAIVIPLLICMCAPKSKKARGSSRPDELKSKKQSAASKKSGGAPTVIPSPGSYGEKTSSGAVENPRSSSKKSTAKTPSPLNHKSPVLHGKEGHVDSGGQRVKYSKAVPVRM